MARYQKRAEARQASTLEEAGIPVSSGGIRDAPQIHRGNRGVPGSFTDEDEQVAKAVFVSEYLKVFGIIHANGVKEKSSWALPQQRIGKFHHHKRRRTNNNSGTNTSQQCIGGAPV